MVLGHKENGVFHPHGNGSGIYSSQLQNRDNSQVVVPHTPNHQKNISNFINSQKEKFDERKRMKNIDSNDSGTGTEKQKHDLEVRKNEDELRSLMHKNISPIFLIRNLKEFRKHKGDKIDPQTLHILNGEIDGLEKELKQQDKDEQKQKEIERKSGENVLFPNGSHNPDKTGEKELKQQEKIEERHENINKNLDKKDEHLQHELQKLADKQKRIEEKESQIKASKEGTPQQREQRLVEVKKSKEEISANRQQVLSGLSQADKQVLLSLGVV